MTIRLDRAVLEKLHDLLSPLVEIGDEESLASLLDACGWDANVLGITDLSTLITSISELLADLDAIRDLVDREHLELADLGEAMAPLAITVGQLMSAIEGMTAAATVPGDALGKLAEDLGGVLLTRLLLTRTPTLALGLQLTGILRKTTVAEILTSDGRVARRGEPRLTLDFGAASAALKDPFAYLRKEFFEDEQGAWQAATAIADAIGPALADQLIAYGFAAGYGIVPADITLPFTQQEHAAADQMLVVDMALGSGAAPAGGLLRLALGVTDDRLATDGPGLLLGAGGELHVVLSASAGDVTLRVGGALAPLVLSKAGLRPADSASLMPSFDVSVGFATHAGTAPTFRLGAEDGMRCEIGGLSLSVGFAVDGDGTDVRGTLDVTSLVLAIQGGSGDGFLAKVLPAQPVVARVDLGIDVSLRSGLRVRGSGVLEMRFKIGTSIGPIVIHELGVALRFKDSTFSLEATGTVGLILGPLALTVEQMGVAGVLQPVPTGNLGGFDSTVAFKPPKGVGIAISAGPVTGGGYIFFDPDNEQYAGVLQLSFKTIGLTAIGLLTTRLPDASGPPGATKKGFSLLLILTVDLPPIQLGYGFTLNGVGGLLGVNRTMVVDVLRDGVRTGTVAAILFPKDPVARASEIISTLRSVFPPAEGRFIFGPMVKIGWGPNAIIEFEAALVLELMAPIRLVVLGRIQVALPDKKDAVLKLRLDIVGVIDFDRGEVSVDASLIDSRVAVFAITGDMSLRVGWGATKIFVLAAGGFNPRFQPPPGFPVLRRLAIALADSDNPRIRLETYLALTSNSVQMGALLDIYAKLDTFVGTFSVAALLGFDALIQFQPFALIAELGASVDIARNGTPLLHAALHATLSGPGPWRIVGYAEFDLLGRHRLDVDATIGEPVPAPPITMLPSALMDAVVTALGQADAWGALPPLEADRVVTLRDQPASGRVRIHPLGALSARQRVLPFGKVIERFGAAEVTATTFTLNGFTIGSTPGVQAPAEQLLDDFAPGQFAALTDDERLARPAFEAMRSGGRVAVAAFRTPADASTGVHAGLGYEESVVDEEPASGARIATVIATPQNRRRPSATIPLAALADLTRGGAAGYAATRAGGAADFGGTTGVAIVVTGERYVAAHANTLVADPVSGAGSSAAEAHDVLASTAASPGEPRQVALLHEAA